jgi:adenosine deaminase
VALVVVNQRYGCQPKFHHSIIRPRSDAIHATMPKIEDHQVNELFNAGVSISINTDGRTVSNVTLAEEYRLMHQTFNWDKSHFKKCNLEAIKYSFATDEIKKTVRLQIENSY